MTYTIIMRDTMDELLVEVQTALQQGWRPLGGVVIDRHSNKVWFYQTLTRS